MRLGGDEFALLVTLAPADDGRAITERILDRIMQPLVIDGARVRVDASAGRRRARRRGAWSIADLLRRADVAMYAAKDAHSRVELYQPQLDEANRTRLETIQDLDAAFVHRQFILHYQPKIDVATGATFGAEALVRWEHPTRGVLYPDAFLPVVEQSGLMNALTQLVLESAVSPARDLARSGPRPHRRRQPVGVRPARRVPRRADRRAARRAFRAGHARSSSRSPRA